MIAKSFIDGTYRISMPVEKPETFRRCLNTIHPTSNEQPCLPRKNPDQLLENPRYKHGLPVHSRSTEGFL